MLRTEQLEREAEARRLELAETFDELRTRATPGRVLNQIVDYATDSGGVDFFRNLRDQSVANPLALGLMGAGLAWLMMSSRDDWRESRRGYDPYEVRPSRTRMRSAYLTGARERAGHAMSDARHFMSDAASGVRDRVSGAAHSAAHLASHMASGASHMASDAAGSIASSAASTARSARDATYETVSSVGGEARHRMSDTSEALGSAASALYGGVASSADRTASGVRTLASGTAAAGRDVFDFARDQPLILAGLGLAFGAAMGAAFPSTDTERELMGEASDELRERTHAFAAENYERSKSMAEAVIGEVQHRMHEDGGGSQPLAERTSLAPLDEDMEIRQTAVRPERIGLRDGRS